MHYLFAVVLLFALGGVSVQAQMHDPRAFDADPSSATEPLAPALTGLGDHSWMVTTSSEASQAFFDQGLRLAYAFNHSEALRAFKEAVRLDPNNAMAYWGWALTLGPNTNLMMQDYAVPQAYAAVQQAMALATTVTPKERAVITALASRYAAQPVASRTELDRAYADAMAAVAADYPADPDINTLYAASLMNLSPWNYWLGDGSPRAFTPAAAAALEAALGAMPNHVGALHYYIHLMEEHHPDAAEAVADQLVGQMPGAGHIVHMPSHIYMRVGRYADSLVSNTQAAQADENYLVQCRAQGIYPVAYYPHNVHFLAWSAMFMGDSATALEASRKVADNVPTGLTDDVWALYQVFLAQPLYTLVRFGRWDAILSEPLPPANALFLTGISHYARGLAYANLGQLPKAEQSLLALQSLANDPATQHVGVGWNAMPTMLAIAENLVVAEIASASADHETAVTALSRAVRIQDGLVYNEPPDWYFPTRHYLGAALLKAGRPAEAAVVYWEDLRNNPDNGFALFGLHQALVAQGNEADAAVVLARFETAWQGADVILSSSKH